MKRLYSESMSLRQIKPRLWPLTGPIGVLVALVVGLLTVLVGSAGLVVALVAALLVALVGWVWNARPQLKRN